MLKIFFYTIILICINGFSTLQAVENNVQINEFNYTFSNGNQLRFIPGQGVKFRQKNLSSNTNEIQETVISDYPSIQQFFETDQLSNSQWMGGLSKGNGKIGGAYIRHTNKGTTFQIFEAGDLYFVNQEGRSFIIPIPKKNYEHVKNTN